MKDGDTIWLWKNGDHYLAFAHEYPCYAPAGNPMVLGNPSGKAIFRKSFDRVPTTTQPTDDRVRELEKAMWVLKQIANLDPKNGGLIGTAVFMAQEFIDQAMKEANQ